MANKDPDRLRRVKGLEDLRLAEDGRQAKQGDDREPDHADRAKPSTNPSRSTLLGHEQRNQDQDGNWRNERVDPARQSIYQLKALDS